MVGAVVVRVARSGGSDDGGVAAAARDAGRSAAATVIVRMSEQVTRLHRRCRRPRRLQTAENAVTGWWTEGRIVP